MTKKDWMDEQEERLDYLRVAKTHLDEIVHGQAIKNTESWALFAIAAALIALVEDQREDTDG